MLDKKELVQLCKVVANADRSAPMAYSWKGASMNYATLNETLRQELNEAYNESPKLAFSIMTETLDDILPKKVAIQYNDIAEVKNFAQGDRVRFRHRLSNRARAKQFVTRVGLAGVYEVFKLSSAEEYFEVRTSAIGAAAQISLEEYLDGRVDFSELLDVIMEGMDELIYKEIAAAMRASINQLPPANRVSANGFDEAAFDTLLTIAGAYGTPVIYCTPEFAAKMIPSDSWKYSDDMKNELWKTGRLAGYKQYKVVILEQGFEDETNAKKVIDPGYVWIIPTGADTRPVKVAFEGNTQMREIENYDWSKEVQVYKKVGVVAMLGNNICSYVDTSLLGKLDTWTTPVVGG